MELEKYKGELKARFATYGGDAFNVCADIKKYIDEAPEESRGQLLSIACESFGMGDSDGSYIPEEAMIGLEERKTLRKVYGELVDALLDACIKRALEENIEPAAFYDEVWRNIVCNPIFGEDKARLFALYYILIDDRLPFFQVDKGLYMEQDRYERYIDACITDIQKVRFILSVDFPQKTQEASNLLDVIEAHESYEEKVVLLAQALLALRKDD